MSGRKDNSSETEEAGELLFAPARGPLERRLEKLKDQLLRPTLETFSDSRLAKEISWAANEAAALAWMTVCPLLVFPDLLEEKVRAALKRWERQAHMYPAHP